MTTLEIVRGIPGCGKSTYAKTTGREIVNRDTIREWLFGSPEVFSDEGLVTAVQNAMIDYHLRAGTDVIVDNTNVEWKYVLQLANIGWFADVDVKITVIDVGLDEALRRNDERGRLGGRRVPEEVIRHYHERLEASKDWEL